MDKAPRTVAALALAAPLAILLMAPVGRAGPQKIKDGIITYPQGFTMEVGDAGVLPPPVEAAPSLLVNADEHGGARQELLALEAGAGGYSAIWSDTRDGNLALFLGQLDAAGEAPLDGAPIHLPRSSRQARPALCLEPGLAGGLRKGVLSWTAQEMQADLAMVRFFAQSGTTAPAPGAERAAAAELLGMPTPLVTLDSVSQTRVALLEDGPGLVAWISKGRILAQLLLRDEAKGGLVPGPKLLLAEPVQPIGEDFQLALAPSGDALLAWSELREEGLVLLVQLRRLTAAAAPPAAPLTLELGRALGIAADPSSGGWWVLVGRDGALALRHLDAAGAEDRPPLLVSNQAVVGADLATWAEGSAVAVLSEHRMAQDQAERPRSKLGAVRLHVFDPAGARIGPPKGFDALDDEARDARDPQLAALGAGFLVAWTDSRGDDADVYFRLMDPSDPFRAARRWNADVASSDQVHPTVAGVGPGGRQAIVAWEDERDGEPRAFARRVGLLRGAELATGAEYALDPDAEGRAAFPDLAMAADGSYLATWKEVVGTDWMLRARLIGADDQALGPAFDLDRGQRAEHAWPASSVALPRGAGYVIAWIRKDQGPVALRLSARGQPMGPPRALTARPTDSARHPDLTLLDDGRLVAVWDQLAKPRPGPKQTKAQLAARPAIRVVAGQFLNPLAQPLEQSFVCPPSPQGGDIDPSVAALIPSGFLLVWTGNDGPTRDVFARRHDADGQPAAPPMAVSVKRNEQDFADALRLADGSVAVAWEDDVSGRDHAFVRLVMPLGVAGSTDARGQGRPGEAGPRQLLNEVETVFVEDRHAPRLAPLGSGYLVVYDDLRRGRGHDVYARYVPR